MLLQSTHRFCVRWTRSLQLLWKPLNVVIYLTNEWYFFLLSYNLFFPVEQSNKELLPLGGHGVDQTALNPLFSNQFQLAQLVFWGIFFEIALFLRQICLLNLSLLYICYALRIFPCLLSYMFETGYTRRKI